jgi:hypothetical protein
MMQVAVAGPKMQVASKVSENAGTWPCPASPPAVELCCARNAGPPDAAMQWRARGYVRDAAGGQDVQVVVGGQGWDLVNWREKERGKVEEARKGEGGLVVRHRVRWLTMLVASVVENAL